MKSSATAPILGLLTLFLAGNVAAQEPPMPPEEQPAGAEVLTRGPVHEAFAEPVAVQAEAGVVASKQPPPNIEEVPPADRPEDAHYVWIPGYWGWDADRDDFIWVSACWRIAPPNMYWVPGYWNPVSEGWEWVPGFWSRVGSQEINYLPAPPELVDVMPRGVPPASYSVWVPGCWYWQGNGYVERPGYWLRQQPGWVWVPSYNRWTPMGYVFAEGHWDYALQHRGVLFAPVYFPHSTYSRQGFSYSPTIALNITVLVGNLFAYPRYGHYYFGDYYDDAYVHVGIYPWFDSVRLRTWYDPIYAYDRWQYGRTDPHWEEHQRQDYDRRRTDRGLRPPRTYQEQESRVTSGPGPGRTSVALAGPLRVVVEKQPTPVRLERISPTTRQQVAREGDGVLKFRDERAKWEGSGTAAPASRPTGGREGQVAAPAERGQPAPPVHETKNEKTAVTGRPAPSHAPPGVRVTQAERVQIPSPPIVGKPTAGPGNPKQAVPPQPANERKQQKGKQKDKQKDNQNK
jgi:hypothetical protein